MIKILVPVTLIEMMIAIGLGVSFSELTAVGKNWRLVAKTMLANYVCMPLITVGLLILLHPADPMVSVGFLILAVCPGAPFGPSCTKLAKGNVAAVCGTDGDAGRLIGVCRADPFVLAHAVDVGKRIAASRCREDRCYPAGDATGAALPGTCPAALVAETGQQALETGESPQRAPQSGDVRARSLRILSSPG